MILTKKLIEQLRCTDYFCAKLTDEQADRLLFIFGQEPTPEPPYVWDEEHIWHTIRKRVCSN